MPEAPVAPGIRTVRVPDGTAGRIDRFVADATGLSRSHVQKLISDGRLTVDGVPVRANAIVAAGSEVRLDVPKPIELDLAPAPDIDLRVVYEDDDLLIVDKPAGLVVHPSPGHHDGDTLVNALLARSGASEYGGIAGVARPGIVHRLDRDTSGLLMVAKHDGAQQSLMAQLKARRVRKTYLALVAGNVAAAVGRIEAPDRPRSEASHPDGGRSRRTRVHDRLPRPRAVPALDVARVGSGHGTHPSDPRASRRHRAPGRGRSALRHRHVATRA